MGALGPEEFCADGLTGVLYVGFCARPLHAGRGLSLGIQVFRFVSTVYVNATRGGAVVRKRKKVLWAAQTPLIRIRLCAARKGI